MSTVPAQIGTIEMKQRGNAFDTTSVEAKMAMPSWMRQYSHRRRSLLPGALEIFAKRQKFTLASPERRLIWEQADDSPLID